MMCKKYPHVTDYNKYAYEIALFPIVAISYAQSDSRSILEGVDCSKTKQNHMVKLGIKCNIYAPFRHYLLALFLQPSVPYVTCMSANFTFV